MTKDSAMETNLGEMLVTLEAVKGPGHAKIVASVFSLINAGALSGMAEPTVELLKQLFNGMVEASMMTEQHVLDMLKDVRTLSKKMDETLRQGEKDEPS